MSCEIKLTRSFQRAAKRLAKKHRSLGSDLKLLIEVLKLDPYAGVLIRPNVYKLRMAISSKGKGKSGGARVITYVVANEKTTTDDARVTVNLITIYDKATVATLSDRTLDELVASFLDEE